MCAFRVSRFAFVYVLNARFASRRMCVLRNLAQKTHSPLPFRHRQCKGVSREPTKTPWSKGQYRCICKPRRSVSSTQNACRSPAGRSPDQQSVSLPHNLILEQNWSLTATIVHCADKFGKSVASDYIDSIGSQGTVTISMAHSRGI